MVKGKKKPLEQPTTKLTLAILVGWAWECGWMWEVEISELVTWVHEKSLAGILRASLWMRKKNPAALLFFLLSLLVASV